MKKLILSAVLFAASSALHAQLSLAVGSTAPNWTVTDVHGHTHTLYDITAAGQPVLIDFFFTTCGPCQATAPIVTSFYQKYGCNNGDIFVISIDSGDTDAEVLAYESTYAGANSNPSVSGVEGGGNAVISAYGPSAYPTVCLIGTDNKLKNIDIWPIGSIVDIENAVAAAGITINEMDCSLGIAESSEDQFTMFPNPSNGLVNINLSSNNNNELHIAVYDLSGKDVFKKTTATNKSQSIIQLDLNELQSGSYHVVINNNDEQITKLLILN